MQPGHRLRRLPDTARLAERDRASVSPGDGRFALEGAEHNVTSDIEMIRMDQIDEAYERMLKSDVKYRFVIDMESMPAAVAS